MLGQPHYHLPGPSSITVSGLCHPRWLQHSLFTSAVKEYSRWPANCAGHLCWNLLVEVLPQRSSVKSLRRGLVWLLGRGMSLLWTWHPLLTCCGVFVPLTLSHSANPLPSREKLRVGGSQLLCSGSKGEAHTGVRSCRPVPLLCQLLAGVIFWL